MGVAPFALAQAEPPVRPPSVERKVDAVYPPAALASGKRVSVVVRVTVETDGSVTNPEIVESGDLIQFEGGVTLNLKNGAIGASRGTTSQ